MKIPPLSQQCLGDGDGEMAIITHPSKLRIDASLNIIPDCCDYIPINSVIGLSLFEEEIYVGPAMI